jgi:hypothetical protein
MAQGYAYPVGASASSGSAKSVTVPLTTTSTTTLFTATQKTIINSALLTNTSGGILPVYLYIRPSNGSTDLQVAYKRVYMEEYAVLPLTSSDPRTNGSVANQGAKNTLTEIVLNVGDTIKASCPIANAINVTLYFSQGVK